MQQNSTKLAEFLSLSTMAGLELVASYQITSGLIIPLSTSSVIEELNQTSQYYGDSPYIVDNKVFVELSKNSKAHLVGGFITFDTSGTSEIIESEGCSSITDSGVGLFEVNLDEPLENYICSYFTSSEVEVELKLDITSIKVQLHSSFDGLIKLIFFEKVLDLELSV